MSILVDNICSLLEHHTRVLFAEGVDRQKISQCERKIGEKMRLSTRELLSLDSMVNLRRVRSAWRKRIERSYQRAMDIRDSTPAGLNFNIIETRYRAAYLRAYRTGDGRGFTAVTRRYLRDLRSDAGRKKGK